MISRGIYQQYILLARLKTASTLLNCNTFSASRSTQNVEKGLKGNTLTKNCITQDFLAGKKLTIGPNSAEKMDSGIQLFH